MAKQNEYVFVVGITVMGKSREDADERMCHSLHRMLDWKGENGNLVSFWCAEDDYRASGGDCDSAVFVHTGLKHAASRVLRALGMTGECNVQKKIPKDCRFMFGAADPDMADAALKRVLKVLKQVDAADVETFNDFRV